MSPEASGAALILVAALVAAALLAAWWLDYRPRPACRCPHPCTSVRRPVVVASVPAQRSHPRHAAPDTTEDGDQ